MIFEDIVLLMMRPAQWLIYDYMDLDDGQAALFVGAWITAALLGIWAIV